MSNLVFQKYLLEVHCRGWLWTFLWSTRWCCGKWVEPPTAMALVYGLLFLLTHFDVENNEELMLALCVALLANNLRGDATVHRQCFNWCRHVQLLKHQGLFHLYHRIS